VTDEKKKTFIRTITQKKLVKADLEKMHLPDEFWRTKLDAVPAAPGTPARPGVPVSVRDVVENYLININKMIKDGIGLVLGGPTGVGKTAIAALIAKEACAWFHSVFFVHIDELKDLVRTHTFYDDQTTVLERARKVDVLIIDEIRADDKEDRVFGAAEIESLIMQRASRKKVTILTTRLARDEFQGEFESLFEASQAALVYVAVNGPNLRELQKVAAEAVVFAPRTKKDG
jgi:DNA replication protein DnaC